MSFRALRTLLSRSPDPAAVQVFAPAMDPGVKRKLCLVAKKGCALVESSSVPFPLVFPVFLLLACGEALNVITARFLPVEGNSPLLDVKGEGPPGFKSSFPPLDFRGLTAFFVSSLFPLLLFHRKG